MTCQFLVVFQAVFDQFPGRFSKKDNSVRFSSFQILISGRWCFKSAKEIAPATVGMAIFVSFHLGFFWMLAFLLAIRANYCVNLCPTGEIF
jgi:hypothetical protein